MKQRITKAMFAVLGAASKDETRACLNTLRVEAAPNGGATAVATDGHRLHAVTDAEVECQEPLQIQRECAEAVAKGLGKKMEATEILDGKASLQNGGTLPVALTEGEFPRWRQVMPAGEVKGEVKLDARYLMEACKAAIDFHKALGHKTDTFIKIKVREDDGVPVEIGSTNETGPTFVAIIMPVRL